MDKESVKSKKINTTNGSEMQISTGNNITFTIIRQKRHKNIY